MILFRGALCESGAGRELRSTVALRGLQLKADAVPQEPGNRGITRPSFCPNPRLVNFRSVATAKSKRAYKL